MSKWAFTIAKTENDHFTMLFSGKIPHGAVKTMLKTILVVGTSVVAVIEIASKYIN